MLGGAPGPGAKTHTILPPPMDGFVTRPAQWNAVIRHQPQVRSFPNWLNVMDHFSFHHFAMQFQAPVTYLIAWLIKEPLPEAFPAFVIAPLPRAASPLIECLVVTPPGFGFMLFTISAVVPGYLRTARPPAGSTWSQCHIYNPLNKKPT